MHLVGLDELLLPGARKVDADARAAGASELPARRVQLGRLSQVTSLSHPPAVGEGHGRPRAWVAQANLASGLQVEAIVAEGARLGAGDELAEGRQLACPHGLLHGSAALALREPFPAPELG